jgi:hypothetical protein
MIMSSSANGMPQSYPWKRSINPTGGPVMANGRYWARTSDPFLVRGACAGGSNPRRSAFPSGMVHLPQLIP